jgi:hypothetical protein
MLLEGIELAGASRRKRLVLPAANI